MSEIQKSTGTVKWFSGQKGFGFIAPDNEGVDDLFVHQTEIQFDGFRTLREGQRVEFVISSGDDGRNKAVEVVIHAGGNSSRGGRGRGGGGGRGGRGRGRGRGNYEGYGGGYGRGGNRGGGDAANGVECYNCGRIGHMARDCFRRRGVPGDRSFGGNGRGGGGGGGRGNGGGGGGRACYTCGEEGHFARDCPNNNNNNNNQQS